MLDVRMGNQKSLSPNGYIYPVFIHSPLLSKRKKQTPRVQNVNHEQFAIPRYSIVWSSEKFS